MSKKSKAKLKRDSKRLEARRREVSRSELVIGDLPDRRAMDGIMQQMLSSIAGEVDDSPIGQAPVVMRVNPGMAIRPPLVWELELTESCLRAVPEFLNRGADSSTKTAMSIAVGKFDLRLCWVTDF